MINPRTSKVYSDIKGGTHPLKALREALGMTQAQMAVKLEVAISSLSAWENGKVPMRLTVDQIIIVEQMLREVGLTFQALSVPKQES
jgi:DNA-binding XRE family transcriptional regulator